MICKGQLILDLMYNVLDTGGGGETEIPDGVYVRLVRTGLTKCF